MARCAALLVALPAVAVRVGFGAQSERAAGMALREFLRLRVFLVLVKKNSNHDLAPESAKFVNAMRAVFGEVKVLYVKEGDFTLGRPSDEGIELAAANPIDDGRKKVLEKAG